MDKLAVIDLGSSKIDLILASYLPSGNFTVFAEMSEPVKIVDDFDGEGLLRIARSTEAINILKMYKMVCEINKVDNIIAVGSSSLKNLKNYGNQRKSERDDADRGHVQGPVQVCDAGRAV